MYNSCLGYHENQRELGSCNGEDPCDSSPCPSGKKCVPYRHVCLSEDGNAVSNCPQYTCGMHSKIILTSFMLMETGFGRLCSV